MTLPQRILGCYSLALLILIVATGLIYQSVVGLIAKLESTPPAQEAAELVGELLRGMLEIEAAEREYVVTGSESAVETIGRARSEIQRSLEALKRPAAAHAEERLHVQQLEGQVAERLAFTDRLIQARREMGPAETAKKRDTPQEIRLEEGIRAALASLKAHANQETIELRREMQRRVRTLFLVILAGGLAIGGAGLFSVLFMLRELRQREAAEESLEALLRAAPDAVVLTDREGKILLVNPTAEELLGYRGRELLGKNLECLVPERHRSEWPQVRREWEQRLQRQAAIEAVELGAARSDGSEVPVEIKVSRVPTKEGENYLFFGRETGARHRAEAELRRAHEELTRSLREVEQRNLEVTRLSELSEMLQSCQNTEEASRVIVQVIEKLLEGTTGALCVVHASRTIVEAVATWGEASGTAAVFAPEDCWALRRGRTHFIDDPHAAMCCRHLTAEPWERYVCLPLVAQGDTLGILFIRRPADSPEAKLITPQELSRRLRLAGTIAEQAGLALANLRLRETLRHQSIRDPLTGLFNRRYLEETLDRELRRVARLQKPLAVLMIDLDHFKQFNDTFGHDAGDTVLRELGTMLQSHVRSEDVACRYGGEEFAVILPDAPESATLERAEELREAARHLHVQHHGRSLGPLSLSIGVAMFPRHGADSRTLLEAADQALYEAKAAGRNRVRLAGATMEAEKLSSGSPASPS